MTADGDDSKDESEGGARHLPAAPTDPRNGTADPWSLPVSAEALAATLPNHAAPHATSRPRRDATLQGRDTDLAEIVSMLERFGTGVIGEAAAIGGRGGVGKTRLVAAVGSALAERYPGGIWQVATADPDALPTAIAACGLNGGVARHGSLDARIAATFAAWEDGPACLVIFDGCDDADTIREWRPEAGAHFLVTARQAERVAALGLTIHRLDVPDHDAAVDILRRHRADLRRDDPDLARIAEELGRLPQALALAAGTLAWARDDVNGRPSGYLDTLRMAPPAPELEIDGIVRPPVGLETAAARAAICALDQLIDVHGPDILAKATLRLAACFAPGLPVPAWLLSRCAAAYEAPPDDRQIERGLHRLARLGLVAHDGHAATVSVPRTVAAVVAAAVPERGAAARDIVEGVVARAALAAAHAGSINDFLPWSGQLRYVAETATARGSDKAAVLLRALALQLDRLDAADEAAWLRERALAVEQATGGPRFALPGPDPRSPAGVFRRLGRSDAEQAHLDERAKVDERARIASHVPPRTFWRYRDGGPAAPSRPRLVDDD